jgi:two-component system, OmpR family, phosphate regulon sensor histidine kinase PhoR
MMATKDDFDLLHNFAHDLKAPIGAAKSFIELIEASGDLNERQQHFAHRALQNLARINHSINTLLDFARMESGMELDIEICDLLELVEGVVEMLEGSAEEKQVRIHIDVSTKNQFVQADFDMMGHVLSNLVSNAIKYNRIGGEIFIKAEDAGEFVRVSVRDTGLGIPKAAQKRVFERFYRVEGKEHMAIEGTGLGLAIVKGVIDKHGGELKLESKEGKGSTFSFTLQRANTSSPDYDREPTDDIDDHFQESREKHEDSDSGEV